MNNCTAVALQHQIRHVHQPQLQGSPAPPGSTSNTDDEDDWETASMCKQWWSILAEDTSTPYTNNTGFDDALSHAVQAVQHMKLTEAQEQQEQKQKDAQDARIRAAAAPRRAFPVLPFDGAHILELCDLTTAHDTSFLEELASSLDCEITPNIK